MLGTRLRRALVLIVTLYGLPPLIALALYSLSANASMSWWEADQDSSGQAPAPAAHREAIVQVYAARAFSWRGALGVHTWLALKPEGAERYTRLEVIGWGVRHGRPAIVIRDTLPADANWFGNRPTLLADLRGPSAAAIIEPIFDAARRYPHRQEYRLWPGPNSNTFVSAIAREIPALRLDLPPTAIGKDFIAGGRWFAPAPSGTGFQVSLAGLFGVLVALEEGLEINLLGLTVGIDLLRPALKLPALGRLGVPNDLSR